MKSQTKMSHSWANLIKEWTTAISGITAFNPSIFTSPHESTNKHKLDLVEAMMDASNAIFMKILQNLDNTLLT
jgi:cell division protein FtsI/penicillin-binding protein 2